MKGKLRIFCALALLSILTSIATETINASAAPAPFPRRAERLPCPPPKGTWLVQTRGGESVTMSVFDCDLDKGKCKVSISGSLTNGITYSLTGTLTFQNKSSKTGTYSVSGERVFNGGQRVEDIMSGTWSFSNGKLTLTLEDSETTYEFSRVVKTYCESGSTVSTEAASTVAASTASTEATSTVRTEVTSISSAVDSSFLSILSNFEIISSTLEDDTCGCEEINEEISDQPFEPAINLPGTNLIHSPNNTEASTILFYGVQPQ